jgi:hypothetical protein
MALITYNFVNTRDLQHIPGTDSCYWVSVRGSVVAIKRVASLLAAKDTGRSSIFMDSNGAVYVEA